MQQYKEIQFKIELDFIINKYFSDFKSLTEFRELENRPVQTSDVLINNKPYIAYNYGHGEVIYVPMVDDIFKSDFDDIYKLSVQKEGFIVLSIIRKKDGIIETIDYDFRANEIYSNKDNVELMYHYGIVDDKDGNLYKKFVEQNVSTEIFLVRNEARLKDAISKIIEIKKYPDGRVLKAIYNTYDELFKDYLNEEEKFEPIEIDEDASLCDVADKLFEGVKKEKILK